MTGNLIAQRFFVANVFCDPNVCLVTCSVCDCRAYLARMDGMELLDSMVRRFVKPYLHTVQERLCYCPMGVAKLLILVKEKALLESFCL